jgi:hypothetical protein
MEYTTSSIWWVRKKMRVISQMASAVVMDSHGFREGDGRPVALVAGGLGLVSGEEVGGEMANGEGADEQCDRGRNAASVGNAGFVKGPGCP